MMATLGMPVSPPADRRRSAQCGTSVTSPGGQTACPLGSPAKSRRPTQKSRDVYRRPAGGPIQAAGSILQTSRRHCAPRWSIRERSRCHRAVRNGLRRFSLAHRKTAGSTLQVSRCNRALRWSILQRSRSDHAAKPWVREPCRCHPAVFPTPAQPWRTPDARPFAAPARLPARSCTAVGRP
jgi:hypothetical protein